MPGVQRPAVTDQTLSRRDRVAILIAILLLAFLIFVFMIGMILFSGAIEARKRPRDQDRPDAPDTAQPGPDVRGGQWPSS